MCADTCKDICIDMCTHMCIDVCVDVCIDMSMVSMVGMRFDMGSTSFHYGFAMPSTHGHHALNTRSMQFMLQSWPI